MDRTLQKAPRLGSALLLFLVFLALLASRRWEQMASPQVWDEDGRAISGFMSGGWHEFLQPVNGYLISVPKLITGASLALSAYYYPLVSTVLTWLFIGLVGLALATAPMRLRGRILCAVSIFLVPSNAEVFGIPLYALWWATLLLLAVALWDETRPSLGLRLAFLAAGGLSSPFILVVLPLLYFRALWYRRVHAERIVAFFATVFAGVQWHFMSTGAAMAFPSIRSISVNVIPKFCGWFLAGNFSDSLWALWAAGLVVLALVAASTFVGRRRLTTWILLYLYGGAVASSIARIDPSILHPALAGPRYFFLPFLLTFWILIQLALSAQGAWIRLAAGIALIGAAANAIPVWTRHHDDLRWAEHLRSAPLFPEYAIPIEGDGNRLTAWSISNPGSAWAALLRRDHLASSAQLVGLPTFAYRVVPDAGSPGKSDPAPEQAGAEMVFKLHAGDRVRFRSGPVAGTQRMEVVEREHEFLPALPITKDWVILEFSNSRLPSDFTVIVRDRGQGTGQWEKIGPGK
jgi:hypothetical protein